MNSYILRTSGPRMQPGNHKMPVRSEGTSSLIGKRAIVIEDEGITQMQLRRILSHAGVTVVGSAISAEEGVQMVLRERPDIVLMDIKTAGTMNGIEATQRILSTFRTCIVMLTAYTEYLEHAYAMGASGYILKPIDSTMLMPALSAAYARFRQG